MRSRAPALLLILISPLAACAASRSHTLLAELDALGPAPTAGSEQPPDPSTPLGLPELLVSASLHNPELRAAWHEARAASLEVPVAARLPEPTLTYGVFLRSVETRVGPQIQRLGVMQGFPWPAAQGRATTAAAARADVARRRFEAMRHRVRAELRRPWAELAAVEGTREVLRTVDALLERAAASARARVSAGMAGVDDLARLMLRRTELRDKEATLGERALTLAARIRALAGVAPDVPLALAAMEELPAALPTEAALRPKLAQNPELGVAAAAVGAAQASVEQVASRRWPSFTLGADWTVVGEARMPGVADSGKDAVMVSAGIRVPLWTRSYGAEAEAARARVQAAEARRDQALSNAQAELARVVASFAGASRRAALNQEQLIPSAHAALNAALASYEAGRGALSAVTELEEMLLRYRVEWLQAQAERVRAVADLEALVGEEVR